MDKLKYISYDNNEKENKEKFERAPNATFALRMFLIQALLLTFKYTIFKNMPNYVLYLPLYTIAAILYILFILVIYNV